MAEDEQREGCCDGQNVCRDRADMLGFALQEAPRAAQVLALLTSSRLCPRLECFPSGEAYLSGRFCGKRAGEADAVAQKENQPHERASHLKNVHRSAGNQAGAFAGLR